MPDARTESLRATIAERVQDDSDLRRAYADLRETCASAIDPRHADRDLARLLLRYVDSQARATPLAARFEAVLGRLERPDPAFASEGPPPPPAGADRFVAETVATLLRELHGLNLTRVLDPWAGDGTLLAAVDEEAERFANVADPVAYARATARLRTANVLLADAFRLPERCLSATFALSDDANTEGIERQGELEFAAIVSDLRNATRPDARAARRSREAYGTGEAIPAYVRWMADRLSKNGVVAFVSDGTFVDDPSLGPFRAGLEAEWGSIAHLALEGGVGITFLVRGAGDRRILYAEADRIPESFGAVAWRQLEPTAKHMWRTEILRPEWASFVPLVEERGAIFAEEAPPMPEGRDLEAETEKGARRVLRRPFDPVWRVLDRKARRAPVPLGGPSIILLAEPFGVLATDLPLGRRFGGGVARSVGGRVSPAALRRFRSAYGAGVTDRDVFDAVLALLHHPQYAVRFYEDLRREAPRIQLPDRAALELLAKLPDAPSVGPGSAYGTGWLDPALFEPGTIPDYDDPFASPYARSDVEPGFLLLCGLGAAIYHVQTRYAEMLGGEPSLQARSRPSARGIRLSKDGTRLTLGSGLVAHGLPAESAEHRLGKRSPLEWLVIGLRHREKLDESAALRLALRIAAMSVETLRLARRVGAIDLPQAVTLFD